MSQKAQKAKKFNPTHAQPNGFFFNVVFLFKPLIGEFEQELEILLGLSSSLLLWGRGQSLVELRLGNARSHTVGNEFGRDRADGVFGGRAGTEETRGHWLGGVDGGRGNFFDLGQGDDTVASAHLGGEDLLEAGVLGDFLDTLEVL